ncbi:hypothetical protein [Acinetobacter rudis]|uniref:General secretion pathway protein K n=1 Tax=Acinetobacter rudis CIP 110305 TaxID=421052 RepID=S3N7R9_9GAMM|nr:hypothetical protein [Acinetobacter rudis]EPF70329.1 hypothetical protein F945_03348 [Acinetobacter rudis CIP 110305]
MNRQSGATLVVVMVVSLLIAIITVIAINSSYLGLRQARQGHIYTLLWQNSDAVLFALEDVQLIHQPKAWHGVWEYFSDEQHVQHELIFCYDASASVIDVEQMGVIDSHGKLSTHRGFCQADHVEKESFRGLSQFYIELNRNRLTPFLATPEAMSLGQSVAPHLNQHYEITVISILPQLGLQSLASIAACLQRSKLQAQICLSQMNVRFNVQQAIYSLSGRLQRIA